ncbi:PilZ domain-containing protein [Sphingomonas sp. MMS12-HWE2-04]|uniref:PilZ domain-containing protein n=1 Tax=Sphingomonas sp. MMS12-HWE2-04 TaxID=3234199 RepID=UPI0038507028
MSILGSNLAIAEDRHEERDDVHYRTRAMVPDGRQLSLTIVNISPHGLMARCDTQLETGDKLRVTLPQAGAVVGEIRWSLGGRLGCQFDRAIDLATYYALVAAMVKGK